MNCFVCATPYHVVASTTMAMGMFSSEPSVLVVLDHFDIDEAMLGRIRETGVFCDVLLYKSNNKTKKNRARRLLNVFWPDKTMRYLAQKTKFSHVVFFALDFLNLAYMARAYEKRGIACEFSFGDDGIGTYLSTDCYRPRKFVVNLLKVTGRYQAYQSADKIYAYKPELIPKDHGLKVEKIVQEEDTVARLREVVQKVFVIADDINIDGRILYFEQPSIDRKSHENVLFEQKMLKETIRLLGVDACIKMHPRSTAEKLWGDFEILKTKVPFEVIMLQNKGKPKLLMSNCSTAMLSMYLLDCLRHTECPSVFLNQLIPHRNESFNEAMGNILSVLNSGKEPPKLYSPGSEEELELYLEQINQM